MSGARCRVSARRAKRKIDPPWWAVTETVPSGVGEAGGLLQHPSECAACAARGWVTRDLCGPWTPFYEYLYTWSHMAITAAYIAIPVVLLLAALHPAFDRHPLSQRGKAAVRTAYAFFIGMCGVGHLEGVVSFVWPMYPAFAWWHFGTAAASWWAVATTVRYRAQIIVGI